MAARLTAYIVAIIVGVTFIAGLIVGAQRDDGPVDLMVVNGRVYTADGEGTSAQAVAIQGNKILRVGTTKEIQRLRRPQTVIIDAKGGAVVPGFIDSDIRLFDRSASGDVVVPAIGPMPAPTRVEDLSAIRAATIEAHRRGITSIQTAGGTPYELALLDEMRRDGALSIRVYGALSIAPSITTAELDALDELREKYSDDPLFKAGVAQVTIEDTDESITQVGLNRLVSELDRREWQIAIAATGDRALDMALTAYRQAFEANAAPARGRRHRIEVFNAMGPVDFAPFQAMGVSHPAIDDADSVGTAIDAYTRQAAWASFDEQRKGILARDMLADLVVLSKDIFASRAARLTDADVTVTIFDGKVVFQRATETEY